MSDNPLDAYRFDVDSIVHRTPEHATRDDIVVMSLDFNADPLERMAWMRASAPIYWDDTSGLWAITRHEDIQRIEADHETFCSGGSALKSSDMTTMSSRVACSGVRWTIVSGSNRYASSGLSLTTSPTGEARGAGRGLARRGCCA